MQTVRLFTAVWLTGLLMLLHGCATPLDATAQREARIAALAGEIKQLSPQVTPEEAQHFARVAVETAAELGRRYEVALAPWLHNASIVAGLKDRGLCYQYAWDLYESLKHVESPHLSMYFVQANRGKLNEHHALSVTAKDASWDSGVLLDAWRGSGNLYFGAVTADRYPWGYEGRAVFVDAGADPAPRATLAAP